MKKRWEGELRIADRQAAPLPDVNIMHICENKKTIWVYKYGTTKYMCRHFLKTGLDLLKE